MALISLTNGQKIIAPQSTARPSAVRVRKSLFDMLAHRFAINWEGKVILDGFAGAGTLGFEALIRGAARAIFIDDDRTATNQIIESAQKLNLGEQVTTLTRNMVRLTKRPNNLPAADIVFLDPPYYKNLVPQALTCLVKSDWLAVQAQALIIIEQPADEPLTLAGLEENFERTTEHKISDKMWRVLTAVK